MADKSWARAEEIFEAANLLSPADRATFIDQACAGDPALRNSVAELLQSAQTLVGRPRPHEFAGPNSRSLEGVTVSHYAVEKLIGRGGMGEVYAAFDTLLSRPVAVKFLLRTPLENESQKAALLSEARSIAGVHHPAICTVYDFGEYDGQPFLVLELLDGEPLDHELRAGPLAIEDFLDLAIQSCDGLATAHQKGTIHRDIKPSNLYVCRNPRRIKILDFGLASTSTTPQNSSAKHLENNREDQDSATVALFAGTVPYMSPEQIRGDRIDARSDIFSLGIVFYQSLTGSKPFAANDSELLITAILSEDPVPLRKLRSTIPPQIEQIVLRMLQRDVAVRYQSVRSVRSDLASYRTVLSRAKERREALIIRWSLASVVALLLLAASLGLMKFGFAPGEPPRVKKLWSTDATGQETTPIISYDGRYVVFASDRSGNWNLYRQEVGSRQANRLTSDARANETEPALAPDGKRIAFCSKYGVLGEGIFVRGLDGSSARRIAPFGHQPTWSPDAARIAFVDEAMLNPKRVVAHRSSLWITDLQGMPKRLYGGDARQPKWSPHGNRIAFVSVEGGRRVLQTVSVNGGPPISADDSPAIDWSPDWSPDGQYLYFCSDRDKSMNLWRLRISEATGKVQGLPEPVTVEDDYIGHLSISRGSNRIAYMQDLSRTTMYRMPINGRLRVGAPQPLKISSRGMLIAGLNPSPDGREIAFNSNRNIENIFLANSQTGAIQQLTSSPENDRVPRWSPDGKQIAFQSQRSGDWEIWLMNADGSGVHQITFTKTGAVNPVWSPDGKRIAFSRAGGNVTILNLSSRQGSGDHQSFPLSTPKEGNFFLAKHWSPCGEVLVGSLHRQDGTTLGIATQNVTSGEITQVTKDGGEAPNWLNGCSDVVYRVDGSLSIVNTRTNAVTSLFRDSGSRVFDSIGVTADSKWLYFTDLASETDVVVAALERSSSK